MTVYYRTVVEVIHEAVRATPGQMRTPAIGHFEEDFRYGTTPKNDTKKRNEIERK